VTAIVSMKNRTYLCIVNQKNDNEFNELNKYKNYGRTN
jgi:hypothetical protein